MVKLKPYQKEGIRLIEKHKGRVLLADDMRLGKTIQALKWLKKKPKKRPVIVICPSIAKWEWWDQAREHINIRATVLEGETPYKIGILKCPEIIIINYDILEPWVPYLKSLNPKILLIDEAHYIKTPKTIRTKQVRRIANGIPLKKERLELLKHIKNETKHKKIYKRLRKKIKCVIPISGTLLVNHPAELFSTLNLMWPKEFPSFLTFAFRYCKPKLTPWGWQYKGAENTKELHRRLKKLGMIRRLKKDVLKNPEPDRIIIPVDINDRKQYIEAQNDFIIWLKKKSIHKVKKAKRAERLVRIGYLKRLAAELKMESIYKWVDNFLDTTDEKLVLFGYHKKMIQALHKKYPKISVVVDGGMDHTKKTIARKSFQTKKKIRLFIGNIKAAGVAIPLHAANNLAFVELYPVPGDHKQCEDRIFNINKKVLLTIYYLVAKGTIEEHLCKLIQKKQKIISEVLDGSSSDNTLDVYDELEKKLKGEK